MNALLGKWSRPVGTTALAASLFLSASTALAQEGSSGAEQTASMDLTNAPVDMHEGTCANPTLDPWTTIGRLQRQDYGDTGEGIGEESDEGFLTEDQDEDGILDEGEDTNGNGVLDAGVDADGDGTLSDEEIVTEDDGMTALPPRPTVYTAEGEIDSGFEPLFDQQNVIAVHQSSEQYETIVACGNLGGIEYDDENEIVIGLTSADGSGVRGYAVFEYDTAIFGNDVTAVTVHLFENLPSQRDARIATTPEAQS